VSVFPKANVLTVIRTGWGLLTNQLYASGGVRHFKARELQLFSSDKVPFHVEGENAGYLPAKFSVNPRCLRVVVRKS
jgi:diacylglycerol kinase family enzyme